MSEDSQRADSSLWDAVGGDGPSLQQQLDASHHKCRTDSKISETIVAYHIKELYRKIAQLEEGDKEALVDDEETMADEDHQNSEHEDEDMAEDNAPDPWDLLQGDGRNLQEQIDLSHQKCRADWKIHGDIIAKTLESLRLEHKQVKENFDTVHLLSQLLAERTTEIAALRVQTAQQEDNITALQYVRAELRKIQIEDGARVLREKKLKVRVGKLDKKHAALEQELKGSLHEKLHSFFQRTILELGNGISDGLGATMRTWVGNLYSDDMWKLGRKIQGLRKEDNPGQKQGGSSEVSTQK